MVLTPHFRLFFSAVCAAAFIASAVGVPTLSQSDISLLQFALTLEHLENAFYTGALQKYSDNDFEAAGLSSKIRGRYEQILEHEREHENILEVVLGVDAVARCEYDFPYNSPLSFAALSGIFESVGTSAYIGASGLLSDKEVLTYGAAILGVEARQASWVNAAVLGRAPWNEGFDTPLSIDAAYSLTSTFISNCPSSNPPLQVQAFPPLTLSDASPSPGSSITVSYNDSNESCGLARYTAWFDGLQVEHSVLQEDGQTTVPPDLLGTAYVVVVCGLDTPSDKNMLSGFAVVQIPSDMD
ncbi:ferritin-like domain-containing protein [Dichomitus squalens]|nr:ferritin-like domain-containing protein [Dichomitus squalens]